MTTTPNTRGARSRFRRRLAGAMALGIGLLSAGALYTVATPQAQVAVAQEADAALVAKGEQLYNENACITCHGANLQGVNDRGPSLIGVGDAAAYFQVSTGRMPLARQEAQAQRKPPRPAFDPDTEEGQANLDALGAFIQANGGGPARPQATGEELRGENPARGGELFRLNCASCHNFTGRGGALSSGKYAPTLDPATETVIYTAMLSGPQNMPKFSDRQLTPEEKADIIAYIKSVSGDVANPGGAGLGGIGPVSEGLIAFIVGLAGLIGFALWLGAKS
ncbi:c-type cytochrome [Pseudonocardia sp. KRD-184]|uniref:Cytochrome bc1 complex cytochrome c subunit n=1 Tax=Pseudonocardia oceani TaxID=2792013 RepID=A0ABS6UFH9_9PSEU|nr:cytochrome c [Pseudonocardia oceani]MBW0093056.1 c-type cytochrome [Pseudonocardia oceani]MBW0099795.1 c-type cytochrome [Pseudonocardia oceani]MBW0112482.1 c-type cytochrome [Pseudonocardia oceani]MBW0124548.1 c-type cytochrome [Pseudonocardia oceani]MBW0130974.1 c-type cytochrome [Pseudonocardia oceani]